MKKIYHLIKSKEFASVLNHRQKFSSQTLTVYYCRNEFDHLRVGLSVSKKVGKAHERVKIRRQLRAMMDSYDCYAAKFDLVIIVRPSFNAISYQENAVALSEILDRVLKKGEER